jgi:chromosome segregation ATPase
MKPTLLQALFFRSALNRVKLASCLLSPAILIFGGCAGSGYEHAADTSNTITNAANHVDDARSEVTKATNALDSFATTSPADLKAAFKKYQSAVTALEHANADLRQKTQEMEMQGQKYFETWDANAAQIKNEDIRSRSKERQQQVTAKFGEIQQLYQDARKQFEPFIDNLHDIQRLLSVDLTPAGVSSAREFIDKARVSSMSVHQSLASLSEGLKRFSTSLNPPPSEPKI